MINYQIFRTYLMSSVNWVWNVWAAVVLRHLASRSVYYSSLPFSRPLYFSLLCPLSHSIVSLVFPLFWAKVGSDQIISEKGHHLLHLASRSVYYPSFPFQDLFFLFCIAVSTASFHGLFDLYRIMWWGVSYKTILS